MGAVFFVAYLSWADVKTVASDLRIKILANQSTG